MSAYIKAEVLAVWRIQVCSYTIGSRKDRHALRKIIHTSKTLKTVTNLLKSSHPRKVSRVLDCAKLKETAIIGGICHV